MCGTEPLRISKEGQTVFIKLMKSQIWHKLEGSVGGRFSKGTKTSACLDARNFSFSLYTTGAFQAANLVLELKGVSLSR